MNTLANAAATAAGQWDRQAAGWNANAPIIRQWLRKSTDAMISLANISKGMRVLDVAAGAGDQTLDIAGQVGASGYVLATDFSPAILEFARTNAVDAGLTNIETLLADAQNLPIDDSSFDAAVSRLGVMLLPEPKRCLDEIYRILKPGARFSALVFSAADRNPCLATLMTIACKRADVPLPDPYQPGALPSLGKPGLLPEMMKQAGFGNVVMATINAPFDLPSARHYVNFVRQSGAPIVKIISHLSLAEQDDVWQEIEDRLGQFNSGASWSGPNELLLATGAK
jgi:ubiquinone/menaquinone biosynthesis C-methylase UbiE